MGSHIVILNSIKSVNDLLEKRYSIYSDRYVRIGKGQLVILRALV